MNFRPRQNTSDYPIISKGGLRIRWHLVVPIATVIFTAGVAFFGARAQLANKADKVIVDSIGRRVSEQWYQLHKLDGVPAQLSALIVLECLHATPDDRKLISAMGVSCDARTP